MLYGDAVTRARGCVQALLLNLWSSGHMQQVATDAGEHSAANPERPMGLAEFATGVAAVANGEKEPRHLLALFGLAAELIERLTADGCGSSAATRGLYEWFSNYFPILFVPRAFDPGAVKKETLVAALRRCYAASPVLAPYAVPFLISKIGSSMSLVKQDACETLAAAAAIYGPAVMAPYAANAWSAVAAHLFTADDPDAEQAGADLVAMLARLLPHDQSQPFAALVADHCVHLVAAQDVEQPADAERQAESDPLSAKESELDVSLRVAQMCLAKLVRASPAAAESALAQAVPALASLYSSGTSTLKSRSLAALSQVSRAAADTAVDALAYHADTLFGVFSAVLEAADAPQRSVAVAADATAALLRTRPTLMADAQRARLTRGLTSAALSRGVISPLAATCVMAPTLISAEALPLLFAAGDGPAPLDALGALCAAHADTFRVITTRWAEAAADPAVARALSAALEHPPAGAEDHSESAVVPALVVLSAARPEAAPHVAPAVAAVCARADAQAQARLTAEALAALVAGQAEFCGRTLTAGLVPAARWRLLRAVLCAARPESAALAAEHVAVIERAALDTVAGSGTAVDAAACLATVVCKLPEGPTLESAVHGLPGRLLNDSGDGAIADRRYELAGWLARALVSRAHPAATATLNALCDACDTAEGGRAAVALRAATEPILSEAEGGDGPLAFPRAEGAAALFSDAFHRLCALLPADTAQVPRDSLIAGVTYAMRAMGSVSVAKELSVRPVLLPLILRAASDDIAAAGIAQTRRLLECPGEAEETVCAVLEPLLEAACGGRPAVRARVAALDCLREARAKLPLSAVQPRRAEVARRLAVALDDHKRVVRREAARCRNAWLTF
eukprot:TRINITY_DN7430_c0_g1_i1.p1 TRINITY_DN7430_c0_g1~~TRINITY_DN7430_c0_g1_i1.p1  ORF type:complete len:1006 (+),score=253.50 TRINITY_DN7430_c0_g1_i1:441-3020(+)